MNHEPPIELQPIANLHKNCTNFFEKFHEKHLKNMSCKLGCSKCCYVDISIFQVEAYIIINWLYLLDQEKKHKILEQLKASDNLEQQNTKKSKQKPCVFLHNDGCSIYEVRPAICRTQGLPLQYKISSDKNQENLAVDVCPLNFTQENSLPEKAEWLDLDRLNILISIAENFFYKNKTDSNIILDSKFINNQDRVSLKDLKKFIINYLENGVIG